MSSPIGRSPSPSSLLRELRLSTDPYEGREHLRPAWLEPQQSKSAAYYVVFKGHECGIVNSWNECQRRISGFPGGVQLSFKTWKDAEEAWATAVAKGDFDKRSRWLVTKGLAPGVYNNEKMATVAAGTEGCIQVIGDEAAANAIFVATFMKRNIVVIEEKTGTNQGQTSS